MLRYHNISKDDMNNGDGIRVVLWLAGCEHHCKNCQNPQTWDRFGGVPFDDDAKSEIFDQLSKPWISGITFSGGDPLAEYNRPEVIALMKEIKDKFPTKTIWCYTGYTLDDLILLKVNLEFIDVLVDGEYVDEFRDVTYHWAGSTNQHIIRFIPGLSKEIKYNINIDGEDSFVMKFANGRSYMVCTDPACFGNYDEKSQSGEKCPSCHN